MVVGAPARLYLLCAGPLGAARGRGARRRDRRSTTLIASLAVLAAGGVASCALGAVRGAGAAAGVGRHVRRARRGGAARHRAASSPRRFAQRSPHGRAGRSCIRRARSTRSMLGSTGCGAAWSSARGAVSFESEGYRDGAAARAAGVGGGVARCSARMLLRAACRKLAAPQRPLLRQDAGGGAVRARRRRRCVGAAGRRRSARATSTPDARLRLLGCCCCRRWRSSACSPRRPSRRGRWRCAAARASRWSSDDASAHRAVWLMLGGCGRWRCCALLGRPSHARPRQRRDAGARLDGAAGR